MMLKIGLLGSGFAADFHMQAYREIPDAEVVAVASRKRAKAFARKWGIKNCYTGEDYMEGLCKDDKIDAVDITLPTFIKLEAVRNASERGKDVIVEKPFGRNSEEAKGMVEAVKKNKVLHGYAENQLFFPQVERAVEIIRKGAIGKVIWARSREAHFGPHSQWFWDANLAGGGVLREMGCHSIEACRKIIGAKAKEVLGWGALLVHKDKTKAEDNSIVLVKYGGGELGQAENSYSSHGGLDLRFEIHGSEGMISIDVTRETGIRMFTTAPDKKVGYVVEKAEVSRGWLHPIWREFELYGYLGELRHFVECFQHGDLPRENFFDGLEVSKIIDAAYNSIRNGSWEKIG